MSERIVTITLSESDARLTMLAVMYLERDRSKAPGFAHMVSGGDTERARYLADAQVDVEQLLAIRKAILDCLVPATQQAPAPVTESAA